MRFLSVFVVTLCAATAAQAHGGDSSAAGFAHDLLHAIGGPDHLVALISVGLLFLLIAVAPLLGKKLARSLAAARTLANRLSRRG
ncbi:MAG TPA: HupE/UreJ family protein [Kiloniellaceae bacterium]